MNKNRPLLFLLTLQYGARNEDRSKNGPKFHLYSSCKLSERFPGRNFANLTVFQAVSQWPAGIGWCFWLFSMNFVQNLDF